MTSLNFPEYIISIVEDLSHELTELDRYKHLLSVVQRMFPCDATALLQLDGQELKPLAVRGLSDDTMGRRFMVKEHPRLARILQSRQAVRFPSDSRLPDPYDGLLEHSSQNLKVHDCMGAALYIDEKPWGVLTLDAKRSGTFDQIDPVELRAFIGLTEATVKAEQRISALKDKVLRGEEVAKSHLAYDKKMEIIGTSKPLNELKNEINIVAQSHLTVLILGETGVGKELVARQIHALSPRRNQALIYVNCAALPENIAESELFGHVKGAFTGAEKKRSGKFELADGGTLFLDEIGELPLHIQAKMLRVLQSGELQRVGSDDHILVDVRIVAATNRDLKQAVNKQRFRPDLYHRLSVYPLHVPPLRDRESDVLLLAGYFLESNQSRFDVQGLRLTPAASVLLKKYSWPGNIRELEHLLSRAALKAINQQGRGLRVVVIDQSHLDIRSEDIEVPGLVGGQQQTAEAYVLPKKTQTLKAATTNFQIAYIRQQLDLGKGNLAEVARGLGLNRSNFYRLLKRLNITTK